MSKRTRILLYGNSVVLGGIGAGLRAEGRFEVVGLPRSLPDTSDVEALAPDVIVFDIETPGSAAAFSTLESHPNLIILGVSPDDNIVQLWSGRPYRELSIKDLTDLIEAGSRAGVSAHENTVIK
jgi:DNA-binding NarL/FixJ family response regulator